MVSITHALGLHCTLLRQVINQSYCHQVLFHHAEEETRQTHQKR